MPIRGYYLRDRGGAGCIHCGSCYVPTCLDIDGQTTFWDPSQAGPSQDLFLARIIPENQGVNHTPLRTRSRAHGALRANFQPPGCCGQCSSGQLRAAQGSSGQLS